MERREESLFSLRGDWATHDVTPHQADNTGKYIHSEAGKHMRSK